MIISCPSCKTRYRFPETTATTAKHAQCSRCDERFPLASATTYRIEETPQPSPPVPPVDPGLKIDMDDPTLAPQVARSTLSEGAASTGAMTYRVAADSPPDPTQQPLDPAATLALPSLELDTEAASAPMVPEAATHERSETAPSPDSSPVASARRSRPLRDLLVALFTASSGAAAGYYGAPYVARYLEADIITWTAAGSAVGLLTGQAGVRHTCERPRNEPGST